MRISFGMRGGFFVRKCGVQGFFVQICGWVGGFFLQTDPSHLICFAKCADIAIKVTHVGNLGVGNVGNLQCGNVPTQGHGQWFAKWGSDTLS